jgi:GAF domain-containing protein
MPDEATLSGRRLAARPRELEALSALITRVNSSLDVAETLDHIIEVCAELTGCEGALVYLWDEEQRRLVVRGAVEGYKHWIGRFGLELGEGLTGWTALNRRPGIIAEEPRSDPRYKFVPELNDEEFQSVLTVPVVGRDDNLVGVLTLHTRAPHEFADGDVRLMETLASLVAGAVENAKLHEQALRSMKVFRSLAELSRQMTSVAGAPQTLQRLALTALELLDARLVVVLHLDEAHARLVVETWVGGRRAAVRADTVPADGRWSRLLGGGPTSVPLEPEDPLVRELGLQLEPRSLFAAPLVFESRPTGLLCCYADEQRSLGEDNLELLGTIANHAAIALEEERLRLAVDRRSRARELFDALRAGDERALTSGAARDMGVRRDQAHTVVVVETGEREQIEELAECVAGRLGGFFPGTIWDARGRTVTALVPVRSDAWASLLEDALAAALDDAEHRLGHEASAGFSDRAARPEEYPQAFRRARMATAIAQASGGRHRVRGFADLGAQRYLWAISQERDPDPLEVAVGRLLEIDRRRRSDLFRTLETYLEHQGSARQTSAALFIHRNTLRQRLRRIRDAVGIDPADPAMWFDLSLAVRLIRFRALGQNQT